MERESSRLTRLKIAYTNAIYNNKYEVDKVYLTIDKLLRETSEYYRDMLSYVDVNWRDKINWDK